MGRRGSPATRSIRHSRPCPGEGVGVLGIDRITPADPSRISRSRQGRRDHGVDVLFGNDKGAHLALSLLAGSGPGRVCPEAGAGCLMPGLALGPARTGHSGAPERSEAVRPRRDRAIW